MTKPVFCGLCNHKAEFIRNPPLADRTRVTNWPFAWSCPNCGASVGVVPFTSRPRGTFADQETRRARVRAHRAFDPIWRRDKTMSRSEAYRWLAEQMGLTKNRCHICYFNLEQCETVETIATHFRKGIHQ